MTNDDLTPVSDTCGDTLRCLRGDFAITCERDAAHDGKHYAHTALTGGFGRIVDVDVEW